MSRREETPCLPTSFAIALLESVAFLPTDDDCMKSTNGQVGRERTALLEKIANFQRMAVCADYDEAIIAFYGMEITGAQTDILKVIHKSTKPWMQGLAVDACLNAITFKTLNRNEFAESIKAIMEQTKIKEEGKVGTRMQGIIVRVSQTE